MEYKSQELHNWEDLVRKTIKAKAKSSLHFPSIFWQIDQHIAHSKRLAKNTKFSIFGIFPQNLKAEFQKESKTFFYQTISAEASNKARKKKKDQRIYKLKCQESWS